MKSALAAAGSRQIKRRSRRNAHAAASVIVGSLQPSAPQRKMRFRIRLNVGFQCGHLLVSQQQRMTGIRPYYRNVHDAAWVTNGPQLPFALISDAAARPVEPAVRTSCSIFEKQMTAERDKTVIAYDGSDGRFRALPQKITKQ